jgi:hypothetical protein
VAQEGRSGTGKKLYRLSTWVIDWDALSKGGGWEAMLDGDFYTADKGLPNGPSTLRMFQQTLATSGALCDRIEFVASFSKDVNGIINAKEALIFDLTGGISGADVIFTPVPPGIPRGQASLRLLVEDKALSKKLRYTITSDFLAQAMLFLQLHKMPDSQGLAYRF